MYPIIGQCINEVRIDGDLERLYQDLKVMALWELDAVEIPPHGLDVIKNGRLSMRQMREIEKILNDFDFIYTVHAPNPINLMDTTELDLHARALEATLEFASRINSRIVVVHSGRFLPEESFCGYGSKGISAAHKTKMLLQEARLVRDLAEHWPSLYICLENARPYWYHSPYCYAERLDQLREHIQSIDGPNVRITLDLGHAWLSSNFYGFDYLEAISDISSLVFHVHVHDNFGRAVYYTEKQQTHQIPLGRGDSHMPIGWGNIPVEEALALLIPQYQGVLMMELRGRYFKYIPEAVAKLREILERINRRTEKAEKYQFSKDCYRRLGAQA